MVLPSVFVNKSEQFHCAYDFTVSTDEFRVQLPGKHSLKAGGSINEVSMDETLVAISITENIKGKVSALLQKDRYLL